MFVLYDIWMFSVSVSISICILPSWCFLLHHLPLLPYPQYAHAHACMYMYVYDALCTSLKSDLNVNFHIRFHFRSDHQHARGSWLLFFVTLILAAFHIFQGIFCNRLVLSNITRIVPSKYFCVDFHLREQNITTRITHACISTCASAGTSSGGIATRSTTSIPTNNSFRIRLSFNIDRLIHNHLTG